MADKDSKKIEIVFAVELKLLKWSKGEIDESLFLQRTLQVLIKHKEKKKKNNEWNWRKKKTQLKNQNQLILVVDNCK